MLLLLALFDLDKSVVFCDSGVVSQAILDAVRLAIPPYSVIERRSKVC